MKELPYEQLQSDTIKLVRFPLIVGVVMFHMAFENIIIAGQKFINIADFPVFDYYPNGGKNQGAEQREY